MVNSTATSGKRSQAGQQHMLDLSEIDHIFPPYISLHAQYALPLAVVKTFVRRKLRARRTFVGRRRVARGDRFPFDPCRIMRLTSNRNKVIAEP